MGFKIIQILYAATATGILIGTLLNAACIKSTEPTATISNTPMIEETAKSTPTPTSPFLDLLIGDIEKEIGEKLPATSPIKYGSYAITDVGKEYKCNRGKSEDCWVLFQELLKRYEDAPEVSVISIFEPQVVDTKNMKGFRLEYKGGKGLYNVQIEDIDGVMANYKVSGLPPIGWNYPNKIERVITNYETREEFIDYILRRAKIVHGRLWEIGFEPFLLKTAYQ